MSQENQNETVERIVRENFTVKVGDQLFSKEQMRPVVDGRTPSAIDLCTLTGIVDFFKANIDQYDVKSLICTVEGPEKLCIETKIDPVLKSRVTVASIERMKAGHDFPFSQFLNHEDFIIKLKSLFVENDDQKRLMAYCSKLTMSNRIEAHDDGVTQTASITRGTSGALKANEVAPSIVSLKPFRTFNEIDQPSSQFLFRLRENGDKVAACALFEADGGAWRLTALKSIKKYLADNIVDLTVIA